jgi:protein phosphatase PTC7
MIPKSLQTQAELFGGGPLSDSPDDAVVTSHSLQNGDVVVFATDGVWDNLTNQEILRIISKELLDAGAWEIAHEGIKPSPSLEESVMGENGAKVNIQTLLARAIVAQAKTASMNTKVDGPFAKEVQRLYPGDSFHGGKRDDITVIATVVVGS